MGRIRLFGALSHDLRYALRQLRKNAGFALFAIGTLAIGLGSATAVFSILDQWLIRPLALMDAGRLEHIWRTSAADHTQPLFFFMYREYLQLSKRSQSFSSLSATFYRDYTLTGNGSPENVMGEITTANLFDTLGVRAALGRTFSPRDRSGDQVALISHGFWVKKFGSSPFIVGSLIRLNDEPYRVIGVLPQSFSYRILDQPVDADVWTVIRRGDPLYKEDSYAAVGILGRLKPGVTRSQAQAELNIIQQRMDREWRVPEGFRGTATLVSGLQEDNARGVRVSLLVLGCAACFLLLIACSNTCALVLSRNATRQSEFAMRAALGSGAWRLFRQLFLENLLLYAVATPAGFAAAAAVLRGFELWNPLGILPARGVALEFRACLAAGLIALAASLVVGTLPAFFGSRVNLEKALRAMGRSHSLDAKRVRALTWITGAQIALVLVFVTGAGLLCSTLLNLENQSYGFRTAQVHMLQLSLPNRHYGEISKAISFEERLLETLRESPGVTSAALGPDVTAGDIFLGEFAIFDRSGTPAAGTRAGQITAGAQYFETLNIPFLEGSDFPADLRSDSEPLAIINEAVAQLYFAGARPIGQHIRFGVPTDPQTAKNPWYRVIGVVGNIRSIAYNKTAWKADPLVYVDFRQERRAAIGVTNWGSTRANFLIATAPDAWSVNEVKKVVWSLDPELPVEQFDSLDKKLMTHLGQPRMRAQVLTGFSGIALLLAAIGLYGILSQAVAHGKREIAIRLALGANRAEVTALVVRRALAITAAGVAGGTILAGIGAMAVRPVLYGISPLNPLPYAAALAVLFAVSIAAAFVPARRAAAVDPMLNLHAE